MPPFKQVPSLQSVILNYISLSFRKLCCDCSITKKDLKHVVQYYDILLPPQIQSHVCEKFLRDSNKVIFNEMLNEKYLYICSKLHAEFLWIIDSEEQMPSILGDLDGRQLKSLKMNLAPRHFDEDKDYNLYEYTRAGAYQPLYKFMSTLINLTILKCSQMCDNSMLRILSRTCPNLEEVSIEMCAAVDDEGVFHLTGNEPSEDTCSEIKSSAILPAKIGCKKLKKVNLEYTCAGTRSTAMLLRHCPSLEELLVTPDVNIGDVFSVLHGVNPERYEDVKSRYSLRVLNNYMELDEDVLSLIAKTCPSLKDVTLRCNGVERKDRNLLANLLSLNLEALDVMNCSMPALIWYLNQKGKNIESLTIQHLSNTPMSLTFTRSHLQHVIRTCPKMKKFTLKLSNNPVQPDLPYSTFGSNLLHFTTLTHLTLEGLSISLEDLSVFISKCESLRELHILILDLDVLDDSILFDFLASGCLQSLWDLFLYRPPLTLGGLKRLVKECPKLRAVGPLSSWAISKKDRESFIKDIRTNNWDLNVESPEMISLFHF